MNKHGDLTTADLVVLAVLLSDPPMHGYELVKKLEEADMEDWASVSIAQVYYSLRKMAKSGHILIVKSAKPSLGPSRVIYKPADHAHGALLTALKRKDWAHQRIPSPFTTWTALAIHADSAVIEEQFARRARFLLAEIKREEETLRALKALKASGVESAKIMIAMAISEMQVELDYLQPLKEAVLHETKLLKLKSQECAP